MRSLDDIKNYHAHIYYNGESKQFAENLRRHLEDQFPDAVFGRWHDQPVGPHPDGSFQIEFLPELFQSIVSYLAINRGSLVIFIHPNTGDAMTDHRDHAIWMGAVRPLNLRTLENIS